MNTRRLAGILIVSTLAILAVLWGFWRSDQTRQSSLAVLVEFDRALSTGDGNGLLATLVLPSALNGRTVAEQTEFLQKALRDEISAEGLAVLQREGQFGPLTNIFPAEAAAWAKAANVPVEDCVAFKLERSGLRAEVVLAVGSGIQNPASGIQHRILRLNNVKQLAATN